MTAEIELKNVPTTVSGLLRPLSLLHQVDLIVSAAAWLNRSMRLLCKVLAGRAELIVRLNINICKGATIHLSAMD
jgi:hypothetical protein